MTNHKYARLDDYSGFAVNVDISELAREAGFTKLSSRAQNVLAYLIFKSPDGIPEPQLVPGEAEEDGNTLQSIAPKV